jgi:hypothetical protein
MCYDFKSLDTFTRKSQIIDVLGIDTDPHQPDPDRQALDGDPDPSPNSAKRCGSDPIRLRIQTTLVFRNLIITISFKLEKEIFYVSVSTHLDNFVYVGSELRYQLSHPAVILHES